MSVPQVGDVYEVLTDDFSRDWKGPPKGYKIKIIDISSHNGDVEVQGLSPDGHTPAEFAFCTSVWSPDWFINSETFGSIRKISGEAMSSSIHSGQNNDRRTTCYACGSPTRSLDTGLPGSHMRVCTKCEK